MVGEGIEIIRMVPAGVVLVQENLEAVVFVVIVEGVRIAVKEDVIDDLHQKVDVVLVPQDLETAAEIFRFRLYAQPQLVNWAPGSLFPSGLLPPAIDVDGFSGPRGLVVPITASLRLCCRDNRVGRNNYGQYHEKERKASPMYASMGVWVFHVNPSITICYSQRPCLYFLL